MPESQGTLCGWFGKLPTVGDFASRRLPPQLIETWDAWLSEGLAALQESAPDSWLQQYLAMPCWRFLLMPDTLPAGVAQAPICGVLMPSVDRVGRYFPFTLMLPLRQVPADPAAAEAMLGFLVSMDDLAVDAMEQDWSIEQLESELAHLSKHATAGFNSEDALPGTLGIGEFQVGSDLSAWLAAAAWGALAAQLRGHSLWWSGHSNGHRLRIDRGLPSGAAFEALFTSGSATLVDDNHLI